MINGRRRRKIAGSLATSVFLIVGGSWHAHGVPQAGSSQKPTSPASKGTPKTEPLFVSDDKSFSIWMPGTPKRENIDTPSVFGPVVFVIYQLRQSNSAYAIGYTDFPADKVAHTSPDKLLSLSSEGAHKRYGKGVIKDVKISYHGLQGREIVCRIDGPQKAQIDMRVFLVKNRVYTMNVVHLQAEEMKGEISHFMESFKVLK